MNSLMNIGVKAMTANYAVLQVTGHNIANANVAGYSRQEAQLSTAQGQFSGAGYFGKGVAVTTVARAHDAFLSREAAASSALAAMDAARLQQLKKLETVFKPGESGLGHAASQLMNALSDMSSQPADAATRRVVLARAADLAQRFSEAGATLDQLQIGVSNDLSVGVTEVNRLAKAIAATNQRLAQLQGLGQPANDVLDERDRLITELSKKVAVTQIEGGDGTKSIFIGGGQSLVLGHKANELALVKDPADPGRSAIELREGGPGRLLDGSALGGGSIAGLLRFQNEDLVAARTGIGQLAAAIGGALNQQQGLGWTLDGVAGPPLFQIGPTKALPNALNTGGATVTITHTDTRALQASEYELRADPAAAGHWKITRLVDGRPAESLSFDPADPAEYDPVTGVSFQGFALKFSALPAAGDSFLLQPVSLAANGMVATLSNPRDLAAALPGTPVAALPSDNRNAIALQGLRDAKLVGELSFTDAWALALSGIGVRVQSADTAATISSSVAAHSEQLRSSHAGVNLDEEAARLIQFQQSYQAAAKMLQVSQSLFDTLLQAARS